MNPKCSDTLYGACSERDTTQKARVCLFHHTKFTLEFTTFIPWQYGAIDSQRGLVDGLVEDRADTSGKGREHIILQHCRTRGRSKQAERSAVGISSDPLKQHFPGKGSLVIVGIFDP